MRFIEGYRDLPIFIGNLLRPGCRNIPAMTASDSASGIAPILRGDRCVEIVRRISELRNLATMGFRVGFVQTSAE